MSQNDFTIANQGFPAFRADLNTALQALATNNSGATAPSTTFANMWWYDSATDIMYIRNEDNDAWIKFAELDQTNDKFVLSGTLQLDDGTVSAPALTFNSDTNMGLYRGGTDILKFVTAGVDRLTIGASGNVGIGTTVPASPSGFGSVSILHLKGSASNDCSIVLEGLFGAGGRQEIGVSVGDLYFNRGGATGAMSTSMIIKASGNVGIGKTAPLSPLDVTGGFITVSKDANTAGRIGASEYITGDVANDLILQATGSGITRFYQSGVNSLNIDSSGYVTQSKLPMFSAHGDNTHAVATSGVFTYTSANVYQSTEYDPDSLFNASNGRFTAPVAGRYFFIFSIGVTFNSGYHYSYIRKNDADIAGYARNSAQGSQHITQVIQGIINLASGDYVTTARNNNNVDGSVGWAMFQGFLLG
jgi:hypothetical protein